MALLHIVQNAIRTEWALADEVNFISPPTTVRNALVAADLNQDRLWT